MMIGALKKFLIGTLSTVMLMSGCGGSEVGAVDKSQSSETQPMPPSNAQRISIGIGDKTFDAVLEKNPTADAFVKLLPLEIELDELNGNEKYFRFRDRLPVDDFNPRTIRAGDLMIYGGNCFVLFYESFSTSYSYTRLGRIENAIGLAEAVGRGNVRVRIEAK